MRPARKTRDGERLLRYATARSQLGKKTRIILLAAPKAAGYYPRVGFDAHHFAWILPVDKEVN